jgi:TonB family protein
VNYLPLSYSIEKKIKFYAIIISILLHIAFGIVILTIKNKPYSITPREEPLEVSMVFEPPTNRIVEESETSKNSIPIKTKLLAEKNNTTLKQQIKRGDNLQVKPKNPVTTSTLNKNIKIKQKYVAKPKLIKKLNLNLNLPLTTNYTDSSNNNSEKTKEAKPFVPKVNNSFGISGSADFLPNLPDGNLTLLNTKANKFAVFVRRVANRVFTTLKETGWQTLTHSEINQITRNGIVIATLNRFGKLISIKTVTSSGSTKFDKALLHASNKASDPNPPEAALTEAGTIEFEFHARTWSQLSPSGRNNGVNREQRWLLLGTGLH